MGILDRFVSDIEEKFNVSVKYWNYSTAHCWDPMDVTLTPIQLKVFIEKFGSIGDFSGARYQVMGNSVVRIYTEEGQVIEQMLSRL
ncbi:hypothetical protein BGP34_13570 [Bacillus mycoides]|uniref:hypothetical protein n=1 Tax=Bacillus mycoides TaxID=1405 RepID=UPI000992C2B7|nr:hypothetical protein [Bacillus mycoides]OOR57504.1 hypothetical protein BGP34_13570 [Bacillus mycoides]